MPVPPYRREDSPPPAGPRLKIIRPKAAESFNVAILGSRVHGFWTHYHDRTEPCTEPKDQCEGCKRQWPSRWKGYVHALQEPGMIEGFLELTALGRERVLDLVGGEAMLRGSRLKIQRGGGVKTQLRFMLLRGWNGEHAGCEIPAEVDPIETLHALFSFRRAKPGEGRQP